MTQVEVIVVTPDGQEWNGGVDPDASFGAIEEAVIEGLIEQGALPPGGSYKIRPLHGEITRGTHLVVDEVKPGPASIFGRRPR